MLRVVFAILYGIVWLAIILFLLILFCIGLLICAAWPPFWLVQIGVTWWLIHCWRKNLGIKGVQRIYPRFQKTPIVRKWHVLN